VPRGVLTVLTGYGSTGSLIARNPLIRKVDVTVGIPHVSDRIPFADDSHQAGTRTGRALGGIVGSNLAAFTAELGGKVRELTS
jgi:hypothetical protein